ncbi:MAG TPA: hypothetical protein VFC51_17815 [Chloroflexota bacterium]|nr:hypothetical protein [Chloroflexota bacterium]
MTAIHRRFPFTRLSASVVLVVFALGCAAPQAPQAAREGATSAPRAPKRLVAAMKTIPPFLYNQLNPANVGGGVELAELVNSGMVTMGDSGLLVPRLVTEVPSTENGLWVV